MYNNTMMELKVKFGNTGLPKNPTIISSMLPDISCHPLRINALVRPPSFFIKMVTIAIKRQFRSINPSPMGEKEIISPFIMDRLAINIPEKPNINPITLLSVSFSFFKKK